MFSEGLGVGVRVGSPIQQRGCNQLHLLIRHQAMNGDVGGTVWAWGGGRGMWERDVGGVSVQTGRWEGQAGMRR